MTKEEALKILRKDSLSNLVDYYSSEELQDAIDTIVSQPSLPADLDEAAEKYSENILANNEDLQDAIEDAFKAGAEWYDNQMKMPSSSELISAWRGVKSILQEKDFRGDEWRLAFNAFMFGFSKGLNTRTKKK